jgi:hypothetical protein
MDNDPRRGQELERLIAEQQRDQAHDDDDDDEPDDVRAEVRIIEDGDFVGECSHCGAKLLAHECDVCGFLNEEQPDGLSWGWHIV